MNVMDDEEDKEIEEMIEVLLQNEEVSEMREEEESEEHSRTLVECQKGIIRILAAKRKDVRVRMKRDSTKRKVEARGIKAAVKEGQGNSNMTNEQARELQSFWRQICRDCPADAELEVEKEKVWVEALASTSSWRTPDLMVLGDTG